MNRIFYIVILVLLVSGCNDKNYFWPIEQFNLVDNGLADNEQVMVLYYSRGPYDEQVDQGFYRHAVVISTKTKDTINVLTFPDPDLNNLTAINNVFVYNDHPDIKKTLSNFKDLSEEMKRMIENIDTTEVSWVEYSIVARDPDFDYIANNHYKTVIGSLTKKIK